MESLTILLLAFLIPVIQSACPSGYVQVYGGAKDPTIIGASCCKWEAFDPATQDYSNYVATTCAASGGFPASTQRGGEYVASATCGYGLSQINAGGVASDTDAFYVGLDSQGTSSAFFYSKTNAHINGFNPLPYTDSPTPLGASFVIFTDATIIRNAGAPKVIGQNTIFERDEATYSVTGFICEANYTGTFTRTIGTADSCLCPPGYNHAAQSCVKALDVPGKNWFQARIACKNDHPKADLLTPTNYFEQLSVTLGHISAPVKERWLGYQDFYKEDSPFSNPDVTSFDPIPINLTLFVSDSDSHDFARSYFNSWRMFDAFSVEGAAGPMCQIPLDSVECSSTFQAVQSLAPYARGCVRSYIMRENRNLAAAAWGIVPGVVTAEACYQYIKTEFSRGSACMTQWYRNHQPLCVYYTNCDSVINEIANPSQLSPGLVVFQHFDNAACPSSLTCDEVPPQTIPGFKVDIGVEISKEAGTNSADCWSRCKATSGCKTSSFCSKGGIKTCVLHEETLASFNSPNTGPVSAAITHSYRGDSNCEIKRKVNCEEAVLFETPKTLMCPGGYVAYFDSADPLGGQRCLKVIAGSFSSFGAAYNACMADAQSVGKVGTVGSLFSGNASYDALWTSASLTAGTSKIWTGTCADGAENSNSFKTMDYVDNPYASSLTTTADKCTTAVGNGGALAVQDIEGCTDCVGVLCQLYDASLANGAT